jgi:hypothetical protein
VLLVLILTEDAVKDLVFGEIVEKAKQNPVEVAAATARILKEHERLGVLLVQDVFAGAKKKRCTIDKHLVVTMVMMMMNLRDDFQFVRILSLSCANRLTRLLVCARTFVRSNRPSFVRSDNPPGGHSSKTTKHMQRAPGPGHAYTLMRGETQMHVSNY